jgi:hypothetical protein
MCPSKFLKESMNQIESQDYLHIKGAGATDLGFLRNISSAQGNFW